MEYRYDMVTPSGVPDAEVAKLRADIARVLKSGEIENRLKAQVVESDLRGSDVFIKRIGEEIVL